IFYVNNQGGSFGTPLQMTHAFGGDHSKLPALAIRGNKLSMVFEGRDPQAANRNIYATATTLSAATSMTGAARPALATTGDTVTATVALTANRNLTGVLPSLVPAGANGMGAALVTAPAARNLTAGVPAEFTWTFKVTGAADALPGELTFTATAVHEDAVHGTVDFGTATTNSVLATPPLTFQVTIDGDAASPVTNTAGVFDASGAIELTISNTVDTITSLPNTIEGYVWNDVHGDGLRNGPDKKTAGVEVTLLFADGSPTGYSALTDDNGAFVFDNLWAASYLVQFTAPEGSVPTLRDAGDAGDEDKDNDAHPVSGRTEVITVANGAVVDTVTAGFSVPGSVSGFTLEDLDNNDSGDAPATGVNLMLLDAAGNAVDHEPFRAGMQPAVTSPAADGSYSFAGLLPGDYQVRQVLPSTLRAVGDSDGGNPNLIGDQVLILVESGIDTPGNNFVSEDPSAKPATYGEFAMWNGLTGPDAQPVADKNGNGGNPDGDIDANLAEHALALDPADGLRADHRFCAELADPATGRIDASFTRPIGVRDVIYTLQGSNDLLGAWTDLATIPAGEIPSAPFTVTGNGDGTETLTYADLGNAGLAGLTPEFGLVRLVMTLDADQDGRPDDLADGTDAVAATKTFGWQSALYKAGQMATFGGPFTTKPVLSGAVDSITGADVSLATSASGADLSTVIGGEGAFYLQVTSGPLAGHRYDIASAGVDTLTLVDDPSVLSDADLVSSLNTRDGLPANAELAGAAFMVLPHRTLDDLFDKNGAFAGQEGNLASTQPARVYLYETRQDNPGWLSLILADLGTETRWIRSNDRFVRADQGGMRICQATGAFLVPEEGDLQLCTVGMVADHAVACTLNEGFNLVGACFPLDQTPAGPNGWDLTLAAGFVGGTSPSRSTTLLRWVGDSAVDAGSSYVASYESFMLADAPGIQYWLDYTDRTLTNLDALIPLESHRASVIQVEPGNAMTSHVFPAPGL
ncbi:MAG: hypothetical protein HKO57_11480, partial [Akkermansiaceae bacterium]|nr:hypothetical protein [Akkermansiaceae bacterium]